MEIITLHKERELLLRTAAGDEAAFTTLFGTYRNKIWTVAWKITDSVELAEEIVQDVFMKVWLKREELGVVNDFDSFLFIIARNHSFNCLKKVARGLATVSEPENFLPAGVETPENILLEKEFLSILAEAVATLPGQQQRAWRMVKEEGMSRQQAADALGISVNTVKEHLKRAQVHVRAYCLSRLDRGLFIAFLILFCT